MSRIPSFQTTFLQLAENLQAYSLLQVKADRYFILCLAKNYQVLKIFSQGKRPDAIRKLNIKNNINPNINKTIEIKYEFILKNYHQNKLKLVAPVNMKI